MRHSQQFGFTLTELLIALTILGVIATFTIPKVLLSQQSQAYSGAAKEAMAAVSSSYQAYSLGTAPNNGTWGVDVISPYLNYISADTGSQMDDTPGVATPVNCSPQSPCYRLHNGGVLRAQYCHFTGTSDALTFYFDPDGKYTGKQDTFMFFLFFNGRMTSRASTASTVTNSCGTYSAQPTYDPTWFSW